MKKTLFTLLTAAVCCFAFIGCAATEPAAEPAATGTETSSTATAEMATCSDCGHEMDKAAMKDVDGKMVCVNCAEKHDGNHDAEMADCAMCSKQVPVADMADKDGKKVCTACAGM